MSSLQGRHALVTGASRGLGLGAAAALARAGARVTLVAEVADELEAATSRLSSEGLVVQARCVDLADRLSVHALGQWMAAGSDPADILVNNAAVLPISPMAMTDEVVWDQVLAVNLSATFLLMRAVAARLSVQGGSVINVSSRAGVHGFADETAYCAAKFGVEGLTRAAALEYRGTRVSFNTVTPGARIKPTGVTAADYDAWPDARRAALRDPEALGPAFVRLAQAQGSPTGCRFDAWRVCQGLAASETGLTDDALMALAETVERGAP
ncbi:MAG: SDR family NAD(P)-dependent oxidoreductase [Acidobacteria bacterium]|nr:SDR family NAD(P)-dependent oxidoreductase [Acidobacteriota bacterium]